MKLGIEFVPNTTIQKLVDWTKLAESVGFDYVWVTDHYNNRNVYESLAAIALSTSRIRMGTGVTNPYVTNPAWTAAALATLQELSGGRAVLGLGPGDRSTLAALGMAMEKPLAAVNESVDVMRRLWKGESVDMSGEYFSFKGARLGFKVDQRIPVYIGAQGPKMLNLAGKIGDGALINASHPTDLKTAIEHIVEGASSAGRSVTEVDITAYTCFSVDVDGAKAKSKAAEVVAFIVAGCPPEVLRRHGISDEEANKLREAIAKGDFATLFSHVKENMLSAFSIAGTPEECLSKLQEVAKTGVTQFVVGSPIGPKKADAIKLISEKLIPTLKS